MLTAFKDNLEVNTEYRFLLIVVRYLHTLLIGGKARSVVELWCYH